MAVCLKNFGIKSLNNRHLIFKALSTNKSYTMSEALNKVPDVDIDEFGRFKYVLVNVYDNVNNISKSVVRGYARAQWHADVFDQLRSQISEIPELSAKCLGGGRIEHDPDERTIKVYGHSQQFGKADHDVTVGILEKKYSGYTITCTDEGY